MRTEIIHEDGSVTPSAVVVPPDAQLFDVFWEKKNDRSGNFNSYILMVRLWIETAQGYELNFQLRVAATPADRLRAMRDYGFIA